MRGTWPMPGLGAEGEMAASGNRTRIREEGGHEDSSLGSEGRPGLERVRVPGRGLKRECGGEAGSAGRGAMGSCLEHREGSALEARGKAILRDTGKCLLGSQLPQGSDPPGRRWALVRQGNVTARTQPVVLDGLGSTLLLRQGTRSFCTSVSLSIKWG